MLKHRLKELLKKCGVRAKVYVFPINHAILSICNGIVIRVPSSTKIDDLLGHLSSIKFSQISIIKDLSWWECLFKKIRFKFLNKPTVILPDAEIVDKWEEEFKRKLKE